MDHVQRSIKGFLVAVSLALVLTACGSGDTAWVDPGPDPALANLDGWWTLSYRATGSQDTYRATLIHEADDTGDAVVMGDMVLDRSGTALTCIQPPEGGPNRAEMHFTVRSADLFDGVMCGYEDGWASGCVDFRFDRRVPPEGELRMLGTLLTSPLDVDCDTAYAIMGWHDDWHEYDIYDSGAHEQNTVSINFMGAGGLPAPGTYVVGTGDVSVSVYLVEGSGYASSGTVTVTEATADRFVGSFDILVDGGDANGSFDVPILITRDETTGTGPGLPFKRLTR